MDSVAERDGRLLDIVDTAWKKDKLPHEDIAVPALELPELEPDNGSCEETVREEEQKWTDLALQSLHDTQHSGSH